MFRYKYVYPLIPNLLNQEVLLPITNDMIPNIKPYYYISNYGRVFHIHTGKYLEQAMDTNGYMFVTLSTYTGTKHCSIHRLVLLAFIPIENSDEFQVNHIDGVKTNNHISNLEWCTRSYNMLHAYENGLHQSISNITEYQAVQVCELLSKSKYTNKEIGAMVGISPEYVQSIKSGHSWKRVSKDYEFNRRQGRLFDDIEVRRLCQYFQDNNRNGNINAFCKQALMDMNMNSDDRYVDTARKIYGRRYYTDISKDYKY